jgi:hypothetical protein
VTRAHSCILEAIEGVQTAVGSMSLDAYVVSWTTRRAAERAIEIISEASRQTIEEIPYDLWHEYDPADTMRFYALRLHEAGVLSGSPNALIDEGSDWRFVNQLRRELKT